MVNEASGRRPLKSRNTAWAGFFSRTMLAMGLKPNTVSVLSVVCAAGAGAAMLAAKHPGYGWVMWIIAAAGVQLRLFCNLMDGLLAVEGGLKSPTGELFNEIPDRIGDILILVPMGYAGGTAWTVALGWTAAAGAVLTAYIRALGASITGTHDFRGPMAKPHRMAAVTVGCAAMTALHLTKPAVSVIPVCLAAINAGIVITCWRRISHLAANMKLQPPSHE